jgi:hypothetical protein
MALVGLALILTGVLAAFYVHQLDILWVIGSALCFIGVFAAVVAAAGKSEERKKQNP